MTLAIPSLRSTARIGLLPEGWPVLALLWGYPLWWALGVASYVWIGAAVVAGLWLWGRSRVESPPGFGLWLLFLGWMLLSATQLEVGSSILVYGYRTAIYLASGVLMLYVYNLAASARRSTVSAMAAFWVMTIGFGLVTLLVPNIEFVSPFEQILPGGLASNNFIQQLSRPSLAQIHDFLGYPVARPAAPFGFTNDWGSAVGLVAPFAWLVASRTKGWKRILAAAIGLAALIPIVQSLNRGLWISLGAAVAWVALRGVVQGRIKTLAMLLAAAGIVAGLIMATPLGELATGRLEHGHSDDRRLNLYGQSIDGIEASPLVGYGGPIEDPEKPGRAPIGTHGQIWLVAFSHGIPAAACFVAFLLVVLWRTRSGRQGSVAFAANTAILVALVQLPIYTFLPAQMPLIALMAGLGLADAIKGSE